MSNLQHRQLILPLPFDHHPVHSFFHVTFNSSGGRTPFIDPSLLLPALPFFLPAFISNTPEDLQQIFFKKCYPISASIVGQDLVVSAGSLEGLLSENSAGKSFLRRVKRFLPPRSARMRFCKSVWRVDAGSGFMPRSFLYVP